MTPPSAAALGLAAKFAGLTTVRFLHGETVTDNSTVCVPDAERLVAFHELVAYNPYPFARERAPAAPAADDWGMGNVSTRAVAFSCGHLTLDDRPLTHRHDPIELTRCAQLAESLASQLATFYVGEGARLGPFFAAAVAGEPVAAEVTEELVRRAFGGTLFPDIQFSVKRLVPHPPPPPKRRRPPCGRWTNPLGVYVRLDDLPDPDGDIDAQQFAAWDAFADWFTAIPGLSAHASVGIGFSDADPGPLKPRLLLALTSAGSLVGVIGYETQA